MKPIDCGDLGYRSAASLDAATPEKIPASSVPTLPQCIDDVFTLEPNAITQC